MKTLEFRVGFLVIATLSIAIAMLYVVGSDFNTLGSSNSYHFFLNDANGLTKGSKVKLAGIDVGHVKNIELVNNKAKVELSVSKRLSLDASIIIRDDGLLGDRYVTITNGISDDLLKDNSEIVKVTDGGTFDQAVDKMASLSSSIELIPQLLGESNGANSPLVNTIKNLETMTYALSEITTKRKTEISNILVMMNRVTGKMDTFLDDWDESWNRILSSVDKMEVAFNNIKSITDKIQRGEGGLGKLIHEDETVDNINTAISGVSELIERQSKMKTVLDIRGDYFTSDIKTKTNISVIAQPGPDRQFELSIIDDPIANSDSKLRFNATYAHRLYDFTIRAGIIENSGGFGIDYSLVPDTLKVAVESFRLSERLPRLRSYLRYGFAKGVYFAFGMDKLLQNSSTFVGLGIMLSNDDLKTLFLLP